MLCKEQGLIQINVNRIWNIKLHSNYIKYFQRYLTDSWSGAFEYYRVLRKEALGWLK